MNRTRKHALTLPELIIGTAMLAIIGAALASFTTAMAAGWTNSDSQFKIENATKRTSDALESTLAGMRYVAQSKASTSSSPGSYVFYWSKDGVSASADRKAQLGEMALMEYVPADKTVWVYKPKTTGLTASQKATLQSDTWGDQTSAEILTYFKGLDSIEKVPLVGGATSGIDVNSANFNYFTPTGSKSMTSYQLELKKGTATKSSSGSVPMRAGQKPTNFS